MDLLHRVDAYRCRVRHGGTTDASPSMHSRLAHLLIWPICCMHSNRAHLLTPPRAAPPFFGRCAASVRHVATHLRGSEQRTPLPAGSRRRVAADLAELNVRDPISSAGSRAVAEGGGASRLWSAATHQALRVQQSATAADDSEAREWSERTQLVHARRRLASAPVPHLHPSLASPLHLPCRLASASLPPLYRICTPPLHLPCISLASPLHLSYISPCISPCMHLPLASLPHLPLRLPLHLPLHPLALLAGARFARGGRGAATAPAGAAAASACAAASDGR